MVEGLLTGAGSIGDLSPCSSSSPTKAPCALSTNLGAGSAAFLVAEGVVSSTSISYACSEISGYDGANVSLPLCSMDGSVEKLETATRYKRDSTQENPLI